MPASSSHCEKLWVGERTDNGAMWVYDPTIQHHDPNIIFAFCVTREEMREYPKAQVKSMLSTVKSAKRDVAVEKYLKWYIQRGINFVESDKRNKLELEAAKKSKFLRLHKEYLEERRLPFTGTNEPLSKGNRKTHCYHCKQPLDSHFFIQCNSCNWLICHCGACGCGYETHASK